jgi:hypothetical protein
VWHAHKTQLKRRTQPRPRTKPAAQYQPIIPRQPEKPTHLEGAHLPRKSAAPKIMTEATNACVTLRRNARGYDFDLTTHSDINSAPQQRNRY